MLREASAQTGGTSLPLYGASQAGAVLRYKLAPASPYRPAVYLRAVTALGGARETDLAAGLAARPIAGVPVTAHIEARATRRGSNVEVRPAAFIVGGFDEVRLPLKLRASGYAQGGYIGGKDSTAFADGNLLVERELLTTGKTRFGLGGGVWGGAQRGASRLDVGPSASLRFPIGKGYGRMALDYRIRAGGNAAPEKGPALTLSAGF